MQIPKNLQLLIDGDMILYNAACAAEKRIYRIYIKGQESTGFVHEVHLKKEAKEWIEGQNSKFEYIPELEINIEPKHFAFNNAKLLIKKCLEQCKTDKYKIYLSPTTGNFREELACTVPYKGTRWSPRRREEEYKKGRWTEWLKATEDSYSYQEKPFHYERVREYLIDVHGATVTTGQEADDILGIKQRKTFNDAAKKKAAKTIICTLDKDLRTVPGYHYNWRDEELQWVSEEDAMHNFYVQLLTGDKSDNILGLPLIADWIYEQYGIKKTTGIGPVTASKLLDGCKTEKDYILAVYKAYLSYTQQELNLQDGQLAHEAAIKLINENGALLKIRQHKNEIWRIPENIIF